MQKNGSKNQLIMEKWEHFENAQKWSLSKGYRLCKIVTLGQKIEMHKKMLKTFLQHIAVVLCKKWVDAFEGESNSCLSPSPLDWNQLLAPARLTEALWTSICMSFLVAFRAARIASLPLTSHHHSSSLFMNHEHDHKVATFWRVFCLL